MVHKAVYKLAFFRILQLTAVNLDFVSASFQIGLFVFIEN